MPVEAKPLFRPEVVRPHLLGLPLPAHARETIAKWAGMIASGLADGFKEKELLPDFLADVFRGVLGYARAIDDGQRWTVSWEKHVEVDGKFADAVLGDFRPGSERFVVAVEGKGPKDPLDRPHAGRKMSAVDQGYRYAINLPCDWVIVTSMRQTRLYHKGSDQYTYERFDTEAMARDDLQLRRFVFLLGAARVVPPVGSCHLVDLLQTSEKVGKDLTKEFYVKYANLREDAFLKLCEANPTVTPQDMLASTQKILDRVMFCAFSEDRGLLPSDSIEKAYKHKDPYNPRPIWENFRGLFRAVDKGDSELKISAYNGGLFAADSQLDALNVPDEVCHYFEELAGYEYRPPHEVAKDDKAKLIDVDILGHIFEQSITDLERIRNELEGLTERLGRDQHASRRKKEGAFYTPAFITRYIVGQALGTVLADRFEALRIRHAVGTESQFLVNPSIYNPKRFNKGQRETLIRFWAAWQDEVLSKIKIVDPSCGSGAFLIEAFEQLYQAYEISNDRLEELRDRRPLFDLNSQILQNNLYGVDINGEAVQIARLSLWIKTARRGKALTSLDQTIRVGNSVVADSTVHPHAFDWKTTFPEVFANDGGFDVVVGNPPYVRERWIAPYKPYLQKAFADTYHGTADLYVYFYELGMKILRPGGRLSFIVTNKWLKAAYGEPLRRYFANHAWVESVIDFGHAKQIFEDADVFPSIIVARKPTPDLAPTTTRVCAIPREQLRISDLNNQIESEGFDVERSDLGSNAWSLERKGVFNLLAKISERGIPLAEFASAKPYRGILTGFNDAFLIDSETRKQLITTDPGCSDLIKPYLRGQDISRWQADWPGLWMIALKSSNNHSWPWSDSGEAAEADFQQTYPTLHTHFKQYENQLRKRLDKGRYFWELRTCAYWSSFEKPKIFYQDITWESSFNLDTKGTLSNNTVYFLPTSNIWTLATLNSPAAWAFAWRKAQHGKDEALRFFTTFLESFPIPTPTQEQDSSCQEAVSQLIEIAKHAHEIVSSVLDWLKVEHEVSEPTTKLQSPIALDSDALIAEVRKVRGKKKPLSLAALRALREEHTRKIVPAQGLAAEARGLERQVSDLVNQAYGLTPDEVRLMWQTAPPRMPIAPPPGMTEAGDS